MTSFPRLNQGINTLVSGSMFISCMCATGTDRPCNSNILKSMKIHHQGYRYTRLSLSPT